MEDSSRFGHPPGGAGGKAPPGPPEGPAARTTRPGGPARGGVPRRSAFGSGLRIRCGPGRWAGDSIGSLRGEPPGGWPPARVLRRRRVSTDDPGRALPGWRPGEEPPAIARKRGGEARPVNPGCAAPCQVPAPSSPVRPSVPRVRPALRPSPRPSRAPRPGPDAVPEPGEDRGGPSRAKRGGRRAWEGTRSIASLRSLFPRPRRVLDLRRDSLGQDVLDGAFEEVHPHVFVAVHLDDDFPVLLLHVLDHLAHDP